MKLKFFFLLWITISAGAGAYSQKITISEKSVSLERIIAMIRQQTGYEVLYDETAARNVHLSGVHLKEASLEEALSFCLKQNGLDYEIRHKTIIITASLKSNKGAGQASSKPDVKGVVTDEAGGPIAGATVLLKSEKAGYSRGTATDEKGGFFFGDVPAADDYQFTISFVNHETKILSGYTLPMKGLSVNIQLKQAAGALDDVVVLGFGQTQRKIAQTGSTASVSSKDLKQSPVANLTNALAGRLPGLIAVQRSGEPGNDAASLYIRGRATFNSSAPLLTIDGVQKDFSAIAKLDVNEIENVTILKDASATALYGVKGANGVIIITTRRGRAGKNQIHAEVQRAVQQATRLPHYLGSYQYALLANEAYMNDNPSSTLPPFPDSAIEAYRTHSDLLRYPDVNWVKEMIKPSSLTRGDFNLSGGTEKARYFVNVGYTQQEGLYKVTRQPKYDPSNWLRRYNFRSNIDLQVDPDFSLSLNLFGAIENTNGPNIDASALLGYLEAVQPYAAPVKYPTGFYGRNPSAGLNPVKEMNTLGFRQGFNSSLSGQFSATRKLDFITRGLFVKGNYSFDGYYINSLIRSQSVREAYYTGSGSPLDTSSYTFRGTDNPLSAPSSSYTQNRDVWMDVSLNYQRKFGRHDVSGLLLANRTQRVLGGAVPYVSQGLVTRLTYNYRSRYFAEFDAGYNGTDNFSAQHRYGLNPAISAGWVLSEEDFIKNIPFVDFLKMRASYGLTGNDQLNGRRWLFISQYDRKGGYAFGDPLVVLPGVVEGALSNPAVTWETSRKLNLGADMRLFKGLLSLTFDLFRERRDNILITRSSVPSLLGVSTSNLPPVNFGSVENNGFEVDITHQQTVGKLTYFVRANLSYAHNKVLFMDEEHRQYDYLKRTGHPIGQLFGQTAIGFFKGTDDIAGSPAQYGTLIPGDIKYLDKNKDGVVDDNDKGPIGGTELPEIFYGLSAGLQWKGLDLSCLFQGAGNVNVVLSNEAEYEFWNHGNVMPWHLGRWTPATVATATYPALHYSVNTNNHQSSSFFLKNASYTRLKNVEIGYTFRHVRVTRDRGFSAMRVFANGQNLITWDKIGGTFDPEIPSGNGAVYPQHKIYNLGLSVDF